MAALENKRSGISQLKGKKMKEGGYSIKKNSSSSDHI
jgi:hypothetical protein